MELCGAPLAGPVLNGSGTFDAIAARRAFGDELLERFPFDAFVSKTITLAPRQGNPPPRLWELGAGMINSIGLPNKGLERFLADDLPALAELPVPLVVNVMGFRREEVARLVAAMDAREEVAALELNVSCPNVKTGLVMGADPGEVAAPAFGEHGHEKALGGREGRWRRRDERQDLSRELLAQLRPGGGVQGLGAVQEPADAEGERVGDGGQVGLLSPCDQFRRHGR